MAYLPDHTGHRALKALSQSPKCMADLRDITHPHFGPDPVEVFAIAVGGSQ